jgi:transposase
LDDRKVLCGILFVLYTAIPWEFLPQELGFGSGMTCWRRLRDWNDAGVWQRLHEILLARLRGAGQLDMSRAVIDGSHIRALKGGPKLVRARSTAAAWLETPCHHRRRRHPPRRHADRREQARLHPEHRPARRHPAYRRTPRTTEASPRPAVCRSGLRLRQPPPTDPRPRRHPRHRPTWHTAWLRPRHPPMGRGTHHRLVALVPPPTHPLGNPRRHPRSLPQPRLRPHLLAPTPTHPKLGVLNAWCCTGAPS